MGGKALKGENTFTRRYSKQEFETVSQELVDILLKTFKRAEIPMYFSTKESFGDIDIIVSMEGTPVANLKEYINETFKP